MRRSGPPPLREGCTKFFVGGLTSSTTKFNLLDYFSQFGHVIDHVVMKGFGFVTFEGEHYCNPDDEHYVDGKAVTVQEAVPFQDQYQPPPPRAQANRGGYHQDPYGGYGAYRAPAPPPPIRKKPPPEFGPECTKFFVGGLQRNTTDQHFHEYFGQFGEIIDAIVMHQKGFGFVTFTGPHSCYASETDHMVNGKIVSVKDATPRSETQQDPYSDDYQATYNQAPPQQTQPPPEKFFVGGLAPGTQDKDLYEYFSQFGTIIEAFVIFAKGFGFVTFEEGHFCYPSEEYEHIMAGNPVTVSRALPKDNNKRLRDQYQFEQRPYKFPRR